MSVTAYVHSRDGERLRLEMMVQVLTDDRDDESGWQLWKEEKVASALARI